MAVRKILAGVLKPKEMNIPEITSSRILPRVTFLSERARVSRRARPVRLTSYPTSHIGRTLSRHTQGASKQANRCGQARQGNKQLTIPTRLAPWGGPAQNDSQDVQWGKCKNSPRGIGGGGGGRRHDLAAADGLWAADWSFSYRVVAAGWDGVGLLMRSAGPCFDHCTVRV